MRESTLALSLFVFIRLYGATAYALSYFSRKCFSNVGLKMSTDGMIKEGMQRVIELKMRPAHVYQSRKYMDLPFAVQLMRSSYSAIDELDCYAMDEFQKDFFLFRQNEWQDYKNEHPSVVQGNLADPLYFDFISFAQYSIISNCFKNAKVDFIEKNGADGISTVVRRNSTIRSVDLPLMHSQMVGQKIYNFMLEKYPSITPSGMSFIQNDLSSFIANAQSILDIFTINQYALSIHIKIEQLLPSLSEHSFPIAIVSLTSLLPANFWSLQVLSARKDHPVNDFEVKVIFYIAAQSGLKVDVLSRGIKDISSIHTLKLSCAGA